VTDDVVSGGQFRGDGEAQRSVEVGFAGDITLIPLTSILLLRLIGLQPFPIQKVKRHRRRVIVAIRSGAFRDVVHDGTLVVWPGGLAIATIPDELELITSVGCNESGRVTFVGSGTAWDGLGSVVVEVVGAGGVDAADDARVGRTATTGFQDTCVALVLCLVDDLVDDTMTEDGRNEQRESQRSSERECLHCL